MGEQWSTTTNVKLMSNGESIFQFTDAIDFLNYEFNLKRLVNHRFSLRLWARQMGYQNPSYLSHILKRQRKLKMPVVEKFVKSLKLSEKSKKYFELLVLLQNSKTVDERRIYIDMIEGCSPKDRPPSQNLDLNVFRMACDWHHTAILELVALREFQNNPRKIAKLLGNEVPVKEIERAIVRLLKSKLLVLMPSGKLKRSKSDSYVFESAVSDQAIRYFHKQMIEKALASIERQEISERDLRATTMAIRKQDYSKVIAILREAHAKILEFAMDSEADDLYQLNTQFFKLTYKDKNS